MYLDVMVIIVCVMVALCCLSVAIGYLIGLRTREAIDKAHRDLDRMYRHTLQEMEKLLDRENQRHTSDDHFVGGSGSGALVEL